MECNSLGTEVIASGLRLSSFLFAISLLKLVSGPSPLLTESSLSDCAACHKEGGTTREMVENSSNSAQ